MSGKVGDNVFRASGVVAAAAAGLSWCSAIKTSAFCAEAGNGYFINTCGGAFEVTLPGSASAGDEINFTDYARTWATACKALTLNQNSLKFQGNASPKPEYDTEGATVRIVYADATQGWIPQLDKGTTFETPQTYEVRYLVVGGGGSGGWGRSGGGGAGGYRTVASIPAGVTVDPATPISITVGAGGATNGPSGGSGPGCFSYGYHGVDSVFSTITSAGGGGGSYNGAPYPPAQATAINGGSGGGGAFHGPGSSPASAGGLGNTPPAPAPLGGPQGFNGGAGTPVSSPGSAPQRAGGGGGGGAAVGTAGGPSGGGKGGFGATTDIFGSTPTAPSYGTCGPSPGRYFAGGGGGGVEAGTVGPVPDGGGGGAGGTTGAAGVGTVNTGGAGGGVGEGSSTAGAGGSGVVIIRRATACSCSTSGNAVVTDGDDTIHIFTGDGTFAP